MTQPISHKEAVERLKELLFDRESRELDSLARHVAAMQERAGSEEQFQRAVAQVLDGALKDAETSRHRELADAMAPMVLRTLRREMKSPDMQDQIASVMYPRMGDMVRRYVASAVRDMMQEINRRLEEGLGQNRFALWLRSLSSGRPMAELAMAEAQQLNIDEIYLIRRGSGELIHHWQSSTAETTREAGNGRQAQSAGSGNRDTLVSGFLTAITAFAEEAFEDERASLRTLDLDDHRIYIRGSPAHLLAVKCGGSTPRGFEQRLDDELIRLLSEHQRIEQERRNLTGATASAQQAVQHQQLLDDLAVSLEGTAREETQALARQGGLRILRKVAWLIFLPLAAVALWQAYITWTTSSLQAKANAVIADMPKLAGYPIRAHVERGAGRMWVTGLFPDEATRHHVLERLKELAPTVEMSTEVGVIPRPDVDARLDAASLKRSVERAHGKMRGLIAELAAAGGRLAGKGDKEAIAAAEASARQAEETLSRLDAGEAAGAGVTQSLNLAVEALRKSALRLAELTDVTVQPEPASAAGNAIQAADALVALSDRIPALITALEQRRNLKPLVGKIDALGQQATEIDRRANERVATLDRRLEARIAELEARLQALAPRPPTARERLAAFVAANAIFFSNDTVYRDGAAAGPVLDSLADLMKSARVLVRVVGYTDEVGAAARNAPLSQARAVKVAQDLIARGVPSDMLVAVGRTQGGAVAPGAGPDSGNRRVEFEIGFHNERGGSR